MQTLNRPIQPEPIAIPGLPGWTLEDMTHDNVLLKSELKRLNCHQALALKNLLISQCVHIGEQVKLDGLEKGSEWVAKANFARSCKQVSISLVVAYIADLGRAKEDRLASISSVQMEAQKRKIEAQRRHIEFKEREFNTFKSILRKRLPENFMEEVYEELTKRMEDS
jgi:hypothetical protein